jgi:DeoR/GlpR family transcriptional regulator of sugar metabolism
VHRDLNRLAAAGMVVKSHGGAALASPAAAAKDACAMCGKTVNEQTAFVLQLRNGELRRACCAHCGLMLGEMTAGVTQSMTADFLHPHMVAAQQATYVVGCDLTVCCAPSVLSFGSEEEAQKFQKGFGGASVDMKGALRYLKNMMRSG